MNNLYKRIATLGMVSFTAILAWIYCVFEYRDKVIYVSALSLILVISVYALLYSILKLRSSKDAELKSYIDDTVRTAVENISHDSDTEELEKLAKASYVQLRKAATMLTEMSGNNTEYYKYNDERLNTLLDSIQDTISKAANTSAKIMVKYNRDNTDKLLTSINGLSGTIGRTSINTDDSFAEQKKEITSTPDVIPFPSANETNDSAYTDNSYLMTDPEADSTPEADATSDELPPDPNRPLSPEEIAALFASMQ